MHALLLGVLMVQTAPVSFIFGGDPDPAFEAGFQATVVEAKSKVEVFFDKPFPRPFNVEVLPSRRAFDAYFMRKWSAPATEPWMVATGVATGMAILTPKVWTSEAAEHPPTPEHVAGIVTHELVHVYHGQGNPLGNLDGLDEIRWFVEGLATYASGQFESEHAGRDAAALKEGKRPVALDSAWSGKYRYAVCGSMVRYIYKKYGRVLLKKLMGETRNSRILKALGTSEAQFIENWALSVGA